MTPSDRRFLFETLAPRIAPPAASLDAAGKAGFLRLVERALAGRPRALQRQFALFLRVLRWAPFLRYGAPLDRLDPERQDAVLRWFHSCPVPILRKGFWGVKTLILMGTYGRPELGPSIGYAPSKRGNDRLKAA